MAISFALATLGGGCFWCLEAAFEPLKGVEKVVSGYAGSDFPNPNYELIGTGKTGHAEVVQISYDPNVISYEKLLEVFFVIHDPTTKDRQGNDMGNQYRSIILTHNASQAQAAKAAIQALESTKKYPNPIVTEIQPLTQFYAAESYHQDYFKNNPDKAYCRIVVKPKVDKVNNTFKPLLKEF
jgi:peptide-methionine (S)-S-oxide reductase